jgi:F0F1-type ATP synthase membrane subunit c/vacuolar-type H+-ATPase subunit K
VVKIVVRLLLVYQAEVVGVNCGICVFGVGNLVTVVAAAGIRACAKHQRHTKHYRKQKG